MLLGGEFGKNIRNWEHFWNSWEQRPRKWFWKLAEQNDPGAHALDSRHSKLQIFQKKGFNFKQDFSVIEWKKIRKWIKLGLFSMLPAVLFSTILAKGQGKIRKKIRLHIQEAIKSSFSEIKKRITTRHPFVSKTLDNLEKQHPERLDLLLQVATHKLSSPLQNKFYFSKIRFTISKLQAVYEWKLAENLTPYFEGFKCYQVAIQR